MLQRSIELDLDFDKQKLLNIYNSFKQTTNTYINKAGDDQPLGVLSMAFDGKPEYIQFLENKFNFLQYSYFIICSGYHPHIDDTRQCVVSFEVQNDHNIPLKFYEPEEEVYHNGPIMWNTAVLHGSDPSPTERVFYHVELKDNNTFEYYVEQYKNNKLLKEES